MTPPAPYDDPRDALFDVSNLRQDLGKRTGRAATTILLFAVLKLVLTLGTTSILARFVPPEQQGIFALAIPAVMIASGLSEFGLAQAVVQRETVTHRLMTILFWINVGLGLILGTVVALLGTQAAVFYNQPAVNIVFIGLAPYVLFMVMTTPYVAILRRQMRIKLIETSNLFAMIASSVLAIIAAFAGAGLWALVIQLVFNPALTFLYLVLSVGWRPSAPRLAHIKEAKAALAFGGLLTAERMLNEFVRNIQIILIGRYFSEVQVGLFYRSQTFALMPQRRIGTPLSGAFVPALARLQSDPDEFRAMFIRQISRTNLIIVPIGVFLFLCSDIVVRILLGPDWTDAGPILQWLAVLPMTAMTLAGLNWSLVACGQSRAIFFFGLFNAVVIVSMLYLSAQYSLMHLVIASVLIPAFVSLPVLMAVAIRLTPLTAQTIWRVISGDIAFVAVALAAGLALKHQLDWALLPECIAIAALVAVILGMRMALSPSMRRDVLSMLKMNRNG